MHPGNRGAGAEENGERVWPRLLLLAMLWALDVLLLNAPFFGVIAAGLMAIVLGVKWFRRRRAASHEAGRSGALCLVSLATVALIIGAVRFNWWLGQRNAERIVEAVHAYQKDHGGGYPGRLRDLVPSYLESVPCSRIGLMSDYRYWILNGQASLMWVEIWPFGRPGYDFAEERWWYLD